MIYVVKDDGNKDLTPAAEYGDITVLMTREMPLYGNTEPVLADLKVKLAKFSDQDFLILVGDPVLIGVCVHYAALANEGRVNCLKWDGVKRRYYPVRLNLKLKG